MTEPLWALAAGCVPDAMPWDIPRIAEAAGFRSSGMWVDPGTTWQADALVRTRRALKDTGIQLIDAEVIWLDDAPAASDNQKLLVDVALELGARNLLCVSRHRDHGAALQQFRTLCERAGSDLRVVLEVGEFTSVRSLADAQAFVRDVDHPAAGILLDLMHINRSGDELPALPGQLYPYVQACDFYQSSREMSGMDYITAAVDDRCCLGEGEARHDDIVKVCAAPVDVSLEIRSRALREAFPDPFERGVQIFRRCRREAFC